VRKSIPPAVKSMTQLGLYLVLMILMWIVIAQLVFPNNGARDDYKAFIEKHAPLLTQVAENAMDETVWPGLMDTQEVRDVLAEGGVTSVTGDGTSASFWLKAEDPNATLRYAWFPDGRYVMSEEVQSAAVWELVKSENRDVTHYVGGTAGQCSVSARQLNDHFYLEEALIP